MIAMRKSGLFSSIEIFCFIRECNIMRIKKIKYPGCTIMERSAKKFICEQLRQRQGGDKYGQYQNI
jgi:hypothetical protein